MSWTDLTSINDVGQRWLRVMRNDDGSYTFQGIFPGGVQKTVNFTGEAGRAILRAGRGSVDMTATIPSEHLAWARQHRRTTVVFQMDNRNLGFMQLQFPMWPGAMDDLLSVDVLELITAMGFSTKDYLRRQI